jgi:hypothetical protein
MSTLGIYKLNNRILVHGEDRKGHRQLKLQFYAELRSREIHAYREFKQFIISLGPCRIAMLSHGKNTPIGSLTESEWQELQMTVIAWDPEHFHALFVKNENIYASPAEALCKLSRSPRMFSVYWKKKARQIPGKAPLLTPNPKPYTLPIIRTQFSPLNKTLAAYYFSSIYHFIKNPQKKSRFCAAYCLTLLIGCMIGYAISLNPTLMKYILNSKYILPLQQNPVLLNTLLLQIFLGAYFAWTNLNSHNFPVTFPALLFFLFQTLGFGLSISALLNTFDCALLIYQSIFLSASVFAFFSLANARTKRYNKLSDNIYTKGFLLGFFLLSLMKLFFSTNSQDLFTLSGVVLTTAVIIETLPFFTKHPVIVFSTGLFSFFALIFFNCLLFSSSTLSNISKQLISHFWK